MKKPTPRQLKAIRCAYELIKNPKKWTQGAEAVNTSGRQVAPRSQDAVAWCAIGAIAKCESRSYTANQAISVLNQHARAEFGKSVVKINDAPDSKTARREVLAAFRSFLKKYEAA